MSLLDVLFGDFFNAYLKTGNILMRSSGRSLIDNIYYIHSGILHLELDRPTYERCGLVGEPIPNGGRKHAKQRFLVKLNLRLPSILHGKKGFERVVWAAKEVLTGNQEWLFVDLANDEAQAEGPISKHHPFRYEVKPEVTIITDISVPSIPNGRKELSYTYAEELFEWVGLIGIDSPRLRAGDSIDPYLCRYQVPREYNAEDQEVEEGQSSHTASVVRMRWRGFASPHFIKNVLVSAEQASIEHKNWVAVNACGFGRQSYTILGTAGTEWLCWQCED
jgi:ribonuclease P/MRP protein subunit RPP40